MPEPTKVLYLIRWYKQVEADGAEKLAPVSKLVILGGAANDLEAVLRFEAWKQENPDPFFGREGIVGPFLYKTERII